MVDTKKNEVQCPHCDHVGDVIWVGFGSDWVMCESCQQRILWEEVRHSLLLSSEDAWDPRNELPIYN